MAGAFEAFAGEHVFDWPKDNRIVVPLKSARPAKAWMLADASQAPLTFEAGTDAVTVTLKPGFQNPYASVAVLEVAR